MLKIKIHHTLRIILVLLLSMSIFAAGPAANADCGNVCCGDSAAWNFDSATGDGPNHMSVGCCSGIQEIPCGLGKSRVSELPKITTSGRANTLESSGILFILEDRLCDNYSHRVLGPQFDAKVPNRSSPIYLENLALLC